MPLPHGDCIQWDVELMTAWAMGSGVAGFAYVGISFVLIVGYRRFREVLPYPWTLLIFAAFIAASSGTHLLSVWNLWHANYALEAAMRTLTGLLALAALFTIWPFAQAVREAVRTEFHPDDTQGT